MTAGMEPAAPAREAMGLRQGQLVRRRFFANAPAVIGLAVLAGIVVLAFSSVGYAGLPGWWIYTHTEVNFLSNNGAPTVTGPLAWGDHPFGQDRVGRDLFAMTMRGTQQSIVITLMIGAIAGAIGVLVGAVSGYFRGWVDAVLMRVTDTIIIIPLILLAAVMGRMAGQLAGPDGGVAMLGVLVGLVSWTGLARLVRAEFLALREREFVDAARLAGASHLRIIVRHLLPNAVGVIIVNTTLLMSAAILLETALSFLGLGIQPPDVSLGSLVSNNQTAFQTRPWLFWFPGLLIVVICLSINFIGDGLRDAFDPRQHRFNPRQAASRPEASQ